MTEEQLYAMELREHGVSYANKKRLHRFQWDTIRKGEGGPCAHCKQLFMCNMCAYSGEMVVA